MFFVFKLRAPAGRASVDYPNIRIGALRLFSRVHCNGKATGDWMVAGWHWPSSITWRWSLKWSKSRPIKKLHFHRYNNGGGSAWVRLPLVGQLHLSWQTNMWRKAQQGEGDKNE